MTPASRWLYALKLKSWPKLAAPMVLGQGIGAASAGHLGGMALLAGLTFTTLDVVMIVLLNDWGDREVDAIKRRRFPDGCSPKTIPDGILPAKHVLAAGLAAGLMLVAGAAALGALLSRPLLGPLGGMSALMFFAYTFKPLQLNYRGGGELVEAFGVGLVLPAVNAYLQCGALAPPLLQGCALSLLAMATSSAVASGLSDEDSDREGGKRTFTTMLGNGRARALTEGCVAVGVVCMAGAPLVRGSVPLLPSLFSACLLGYHFHILRGQSAGAVTQAFAAQNAYKDTLHKGLWGAQIVLGVALAAQALRAAPTLRVLMLP